MFVQALQHTGDLGEFSDPLVCYRRLGIAEVAGIGTPKLSFVRGSQRHDHIAPKFTLRAHLSATPFGKKGADRFGGAPQLVRDAAILLDFRKLQRLPMYLKR